MIAYTRSPEQDLTLVQWWSKLHTTGEFDTTFMSSLKPIGAFLSYWRRLDIELAFDTDAHGIWFAAWMEPLMSGGCFGLWVRDDMRCTHAALSHLVEVLDAACKVYPCIITVTCQPRLQRQLWHLGFATRGSFPGLWDGREVWVNILTRERWESYGWRSRKDRQRKQRPSGCPERDCEQLDAIRRVVPEHAVCPG